MLTKETKIALLLKILSNTEDDDEIESIARTILALNAEIENEKKQVKSKN